MRPSFTTARAQPGELVVFHPAKIRSTLSVSASCAANDLPATSRHSTSDANAWRLMALCFPLEAVTQRELHDARARQRGCVVAEGCAVRQTKISRGVASCDRLQRGRIEPHRIRYVESFPAELQGRRFCNVPGFAQSHVDAEIPGPANQVPLAAFTRQREPELADRRSGVLKYVGAPVHRVCPTLRLWPDKDRIGRIFPIRRPVVAIIHRGREAAGHPENSGELPITEYGVQRAMRSEMLSFSHRELVHPVRIELMGGIKI